MKYKTQVAVLIKGDRVPAGEVVDISPELAKNLADDVVAVGGEKEAEPTPTEGEKPLEEMKHAELKEKAESLGLKKSGSIADLKERITLHLESKDDVEMIDHIVTEEDLKAKPELVTKGVKVGDVIQLPKEDEDDLTDNNENQ